MFKRTLKVLALVGALLLVLAACGSGDDTAAGELATLETVPSGDASTEAEEVADTDAETAVLAFTECLRDEGVDVADATLNADGSINLQSLRTEDFNPQDPDVQAALDQCGDLLEGLTLLGQDVDQTEFEDSLLAMAECLRDAGYDVDDPDLGAIGGGGNAGGGGFAIFGDSFDLSDPENQAALDACSAETGFARIGGGNG